MGKRREDKRKNEILPQSIGREDGVMTTYATKLVDFIETKSEEIARQWAADVRKNSRTPSYHGLPEG